MTATVVCNYNQTHGFSRRGQGLQSVFRNGLVHHYMRIASSTLQNCSISYFIFDDIASLAGSADTQNVDPVILSNICKSLRNENPYCIDLRFLEIEARQCGEGINVVPRMVHQRMLACRTQTSGQDIICYCIWWGVWWESTQLEVNFLVLQAMAREVPGVVEEENNQQRTRCETRGGW
jgi:hypothetical protein